MTPSVQVSTIADILKAPDDTIVHAFKGTVTKIGKRRQNKPDDAKEWSFQDVTLRDASGSSITLTLKFREEFPKENNGKTFYILASHGDRGWSGLKTADDAYNKKTPERKIEATDRAEIVEAQVYEGGQPAAAPVTEAPVHQNAPQANVAPTAATPVRQPTNGIDYAKELVATKQVLGKMMNLHMLCQRGAIVMAKALKDEYGEATGECLSAQAVKEMATSLFIELRKQEIHGVRIGDNLPAGPLEKYLAPESKAAK